MKVGVVMSDLMLFSRIESAATTANASLTRVDSPSDLPDDLDLILVDWSARGPAWADALGDRSDTRIVVFGQHTDLDAHAAARAAGLGAMWARSKLVAELPTILG